ncbi:hypothetical protein KIPB_007338 [Kipferlia bialata]|uniref:Uncharacterized protein n=1 Tax=Kipferlia bialata TaxID=797122 RepID=A0A9K3CYL2_9EUKA|nr:hypothetical protein KIPB_007338 [Kipferlia bialata]|eukprot:g7338.t1
MRPHISSKDSLDRVSVHGRERDLRPDSPLSDTYEGENMSLGPSPEVGSPAVIIPVSARERRERDRLSMSMPLSMSVSPSKTGSIQPIPLRHTVRGGRQRGRGHHLTSATPGARGSRVSGPSSSRGRGRRGDDCSTGTVRHRGMGAFGGMRERMVGVADKGIQVTTMNAALSELRRTVSDLQDRERDLEQEVDDANVTRLMEAERASELEYLLLRIEGLTKGGVRRHLDGAGSVSPTSHRYGSPDTSPAQQISPSHSFGNTFGSLHDLIAQGVGRSGGRGREGERDGADGLVTAGMELIERETEIAHLQQKISILSAQLSERQESDRQQRQRIALFARKEQELAAREDMLESVEAEQREREDALRETSDRIGEREASLDGRETYIQQRERDAAQLAGQLRQNERDKMSQLESLDRHIQQATAQIASEAKGRAMHSSDEHTMHDKMAHLQRQLKNQSETLALARHELLTTKAEAEDLRCALETSDRQKKGLSMRLRQMQREEREREREERERAPRVYAKR